MSYLPWFWFAVLALIGTVVGHFTTWWIGALVPVALAGAGVCWFLATADFSK